MRMEGEATENTEKVNSHKIYLRRIEFRFGIKVTVHV
jgi:hypothetical protein